ncbi:hypothetical protein OI25_7361 [Paraburkholderia fungorum]|uniref:Uncharacterized protein n=1 Tax=Paraburkholderia fungorum TaxID=134537 RepID=A0AAU8SZ80_9BURK|nr:hypothetical protein [Paraburkholderia fungorum]AJZ56799.1 hypothetical protein OI25_7361 [Paraburkholderia fungorum]
MLTEYLFRDVRRLNEYASQINPALTVTEKTKEWTVGLSLAGPKAEGKQTEKVRPMTEHEKAILTLEFLRSNSAIHEGRPVPLPDKSGSRHLDKSFGQQSFVHERCRAFRVCVPQKDVSGGVAFAFWVSQGFERDKACDMVCLLEDVAAEDRPVWSGGTASTYSLLQALLYYAESRVERGTISENSKPWPRDSASSYPLPEFLSGFWFSLVPEQIIKEWGCIVSQPRNIEVVYRIREVRSFPHEAPRKGYEIFGYPLWIAADHSLG